LWIARLEITQPLRDYLLQFGRPITYSYVNRRFPLDAYQTVYAEELGSAEMPSAGRAFTRGMLVCLRRRGVRLAKLVLHAGVASLETHERPYEEYFEVPARTADELVAVVAGALANVAVHVGPDAPAWVLLEDLGDAVEISVRDEGPGIPDGRLAAAEAEGRLGVARSMRGRVHELGGTISCDTGPGRGTEWIIKIGRGKSRD
jgi:hypothetical protein